MKCARIALLVVIATCSLTFVKVAAAETRRYLVAIGNNERPVTQTSNSQDDLASLHYADDDAASMVALGRELGAQTQLLTVLDADSRRRFPSLAGAAVPPTLSELRRIVGTYRARFEADLREGHEPVLLLFYSGHGIVRAGEPPSLSMLDGPLTRSILYDEILAVLPARYIHLIIDACHAEAVVRPRDVQADVSPVSDQQLEEYAARNTLRRFPNVGAVIATSTAAEAHEWDQYQRGIFTYQVLSALRGAADVNEDGFVEYSELFAFLGSANAGVADPRARLSVVVRPPAVNPRAPIADLSSARRHGGILTGLGPGLGRFFVEDERGNRLGEMLPERGFHFQLVMPGGEALYLRATSGEASFRIDPGARLTLGSLQPSPDSLRSRGSMESSLRRGLFATPFGPTYYRGFVDARPEMPPVPMNENGMSMLPGDAGVGGRSNVTRTVGWVLGGVGAAGLAVGTVFGLRVISKNDEIDRTCSAGARCLPADKQRYDAAVADAKSAQTLSLAGFIVGGASLVGGGTLLLLSGRKPSDVALSMSASFGSTNIGATMVGAW
jgi:hypothetical protein